MSNPEQTKSCVVVGAGMAGLTAAGKLTEQGVNVVVLEKARGVGGRLATRRIDAGVCDHGAQLFEAASDRLVRLVE